MHDGRTAAASRALAAWRLIEHCEALARMMGEPRPSDRARLERKLGSELAARLVAVLAASSGRPAALL